MNTPTPSIPDVLVVGAGPSGLATAIAAKQHGLEYPIIEKGVLVNSIFNFPTHIVYFTTPELLEIGGLPLVTPFEKPTRLESLRYYRRVVDTYGIQASFHEEVTDIARQNHVFVVTTASVAPGSRRANGSTTRASWHARAVVLAIGIRHPEFSWRARRAAAACLALLQGAPSVLSPARRGSRGQELGGRSGTRALSCRCARDARAPQSHSGRLDQVWVRPDIENRIKEGSIAARFETHVVEIRPDVVVVDRGGVQDEIPADGVLLLTGYRPDVRPDAACRHPM